MALATASGAGACSGGDGPSGPRTGAVRVSVATTGVRLDPSGYTISVDGGSPRAVAIDGTTAIDALPAGAHTVTLGGISSNCAVAGANPGTVEVLAGGSASVSFAVTCGPRQIAFGSRRDGEP